MRYDRAFERAFGREADVKRILVVVATSLVMVVPTVASADPDAPGTTFPEQPGANLTNACVAVMTAPASGGGVGNNATAFAIANGLLSDACGD